jgi:hypothetical protein
MVVSSAGIDTPSVARVVDMHMWCVVGQQWPYPWMVVCIIVEQRPMHVQHSASYEVGLIASAACSCTQICLVGGK